MGNEKIGLTQSGAKAYTPQPSKSSTPRTFTEASKQAGVQKPVAKTEKTSQALLPVKNGTLSLSQLLHR